MQTLWRERVQCAKEKHRLALTHWEALLSRRVGTLGVEAYPAAAVWQAHQAESTTLKEYVRALQIFCDLVAKGKMPPD